MKNYKKYLFCAAIALFSNEYVLCSQPQPPLFDYKIIINNQGIDEKADNCFREAKRIYKKDEEGKIQKTIAIKAINELIKVACSKEYESSNLEVDKLKVRYAGRFCISLISYQAGITDEKRNYKYSYKLLDEIIENSKKIDDPSIKQIYNMSKFLKGIQLVRIFSGKGKKDFKQCATELKEAIELLNEFIVKDPKTRKDKSKLVNYYLRILGTNDESSLKKFKFIVGGKINDYEDICKRIDAYARYYLGMALFCLSSVDSDEINLDDIIAIGIPIEEEYKNIFDQDQHKLKIISVITSACLGRKAKGGESFDEDEVLTVLSDDDFITVCTNLPVENAEEDSKSDRPEVLRSSYPSSVKTKKTTEASNSGSENSSSSSSSSSGGGIPVAPPLPPTATNQASVSPHPSLPAGLMADIQAGCKLKKIGKTESDRAETTEANQNSTKKTETLEEQIKNKVGKLNKNGITKIDGGTFTAPKKANTLSPLEKALMERRKAIDGSADDSESDSDSDY
ncbi:MAG: hypothetical protein IJ730_06405 [Alphaproteobacteria bacterium]|nr:hypothetical protein [Alphaproteobacteria bacterium]